MSLCVWFSGTNVQHDDYRLVSAPPVSYCFTVIPLPISFLYTLRHPSALSLPSIYIMPNRTDLTPNPHRVLQRTCLLAPQLSDPLKPTIIAITRKS